MKITGVVLFAVVASCVAREPGEEPPDRAALPPNPDTMVLRLPDGAEVWYTGSMQDTAVSGEACIVRTVEIRRGEGTTPVPLLYTQGRLDVIDDTTVKAALMRDCAIVDEYLVSTRSGQPRRIP